MTKSKSELIAWEVQCYGMTTVELEEVRRAAAEIGTDDQSLVLSILSDVQELIAGSHEVTTDYAKVRHEKARQHLNVAKYIIKQYMQNKEQRSERFETFMEIIGDEK